MKRILSTLCALLVCAITTSAQLVPSAPITANPNTGELNKPSTLWTANASAIAAAVDGAFADGAISIAKISGLQTALDAKLPAGTIADARLGASSTVAVTPEALARVRSASDQYLLSLLPEALRAKAANGRAINLLAIGDSLTADYSGYGAEASSPLTAMQRRLAGVFGEAGPGFSPYHFSTNTLSRAVWTPASSTAVFQYRSQNDSNSAKAYFPVDVGCLLVAGTETGSLDLSAYDFDEVEIWYTASGSLASGTVTITPYDPVGVRADGPATVIDVAALAAGSPARVVVPNVGPRTGYTALRLAVSSSRQINLAGVNVVKRSGLIRIHRWCFGGAKASSHALQDGTAWATWLSHIEPDAVVLNLGENREMGDTDFSIYRGHMETLIGRLRAYSSQLPILMVGWWSLGWDDIRATAEDIASDNHCAWVSIKDIIPSASFAKTWGLQSGSAPGNDPHLWPAGNELVGAAYMRALGLDRVGLPRVSEQAAREAVRRLRTTETTGIYFAGTSTQRLSWTLPTSSSIGTQDFAVRVVFDVPTAAPSGNQGILVLGSGANQSQALGDVNIQLRSDWSITFQLRGVDSSGNARRIVVDAARLRGSRVEAVFVRDTSAGGVRAFINGLPVATTESNSGTPPTWDGEVRADYVALGYYYTSAAYAYRGNIYEAQVFLGALNGADRRALADGHLPPSLAGSAYADVSSGDLVIGRRYLVSGGTSVVCGGVTAPAGAYFTASSTTYSETAGTETVYAAGALLDADLGVGYGATIPDRSSNALTSSVNTEWRWVGQR